VARSTKSVHVAFNELILSQGYDATSVGDIAHRADVGRSTFYDHYSGKPDVLLNGLQHLRAILLDAQASALREGKGPSRILGFSECFFSHCWEYRDLIDVLLRDDGRAVLLQGLRRILSELIAKEVADRKAETQAMRDRAIVRLTADTFLSALLWSKEQHGHCSPQEVNAIFREFAVPALMGRGVL
jgi:AcrR family transcriptional regulator